MSCSDDDSNVVVVGLGGLGGRRGFGTAIIGIGVLAVGAILLLENFGIMDATDLFAYWPVLLILVGLSHFFRPVGSRRYTAGTIFAFVGVVIEDSGVFEATAILGGATRKLSAADFQGGDAIAIMGGCEIDLRDCGSEGGPAEIDTFAFWGGIEIKVPQDWEVQVKGIAVLGGYSDETRTIEGDGHKVLVITGTAIMGGVEIGN
jgi:hypothetical protein